MDTAEVPVARVPGDRVGGALVWYRQLLAGTAIGVFYFNIPLYLSATGRLSVSPLAFVIAFGAFALPLAIEQGSVWPTISSPLGAWAALLFVGTVIGFLNSSGSPIALHALGGIFGGVTFLLLMVFVLSHEAAYRVARRVLLICVLLAVVLNVYDFLRPLSFSPIVGRAAGLFLNPNISAFALVLGMAVTITMVSARWRTHYILAVGLGVALSLSRAGILLWVLLVAILLAQGVVRAAGIGKGLAVIAVLCGMWLSIDGNWGIVQAALAGYRDLLLGRFGLLDAPDEISSQARYAVALEAFRLVAHRPILGAGLGATSEWALPEASHNMYLRLMAELGVLGILVFPAMVITAVCGVGRGAAWRFASVWLVAGLFSHNMLEERPELVLLAMMGALTVINRERSPTLPPVLTTHTRITP